MKQWKSDIIDGNSKSPSSRRDTFHRDLFYGRILQASWYGSDFIGITVAAMSNHWTSLNLIVGHQRCVHILIHIPNNARIDANSRCPYIIYFNAASVAPSSPPIALIG